MPAVTSQQRNIITRHKAISGGTVIWGWNYETATKTLMIRK